MDGFHPELDWATLVADARKLREQSRVLRQEVAATIEAARRTVDEARGREWLWNGDGKWPPAPK
jgi:hypothetical protein